MSRACGSGTSTKGYSCKKQEQALDGSERHQNCTGPSKGSSSRHHHSLPPAIRSLLSAQDLHPMSTCPYSQMELFTVPMLLDRCHCPSIPDQQGHTHCVLGKGASSVGGEHCCPHPWERDFSSSEGIQRNGTKVEDTITSRAGARALFLWLYVLKVSHNTPVFYKDKK